MSDDREATEGLTKRKRGGGPPSIKLSRLTLPTPEEAAKKAAELRLAVFAYVTKDHIADGFLRVAERAAKGDEKALKLLLELAPPVPDPPRKPAAPPPDDDDDGPPADGDPLMHTRRKVARLMGEHGAVSAADIRACFGLSLFDLPHTLDAAFFEQDRFTGRYRLTAAGRAVLLPPADKAPKPVLLPGDPRYDADGGKPPKAKAGKPASRPGPNFHQRRAAR